MSQPDNKPETNPPEHQEAVRQDYDGAWKASLETYFEEFLALLFPDIHAEVDWSKGYSFLNNELAQIAVDAKTGRRYLDKLVKVHYLDGTEEWLLIHIEVQSSPEPQGVFARRMFTYWSRLTDFYQRDVVSLAVLADTNPNYRPNSFEFSRSGTQIAFTYPIAKLTDYETESQWSSLKESDNVFALLVMAQIKAKRLKGHEADLLSHKTGLVRTLFERNYQREDIIQLFKLIDWMILLPNLETAEFKKKVINLEREFNMPYINTVESLARKEGFEEAEKRFEQERLQERRDTVRQLLSAGALNNLTDEQIAQTFKLSVEEVASIRLGSQH